MVVMLNMRIPNRILCLLAPLGGSPPVMRADSAHRHANVRHSACPVWHRPSPHPLVPQREFGLVPVSRVFGPNRTEFLRSVVLTSTQVDTVTAVPRLDGENDLRGPLKTGQSWTGQDRPVAPDPQARDCSTASLADSPRPP